MKSQDATVTMRMNLENVVPTERSRSPKATY